MSGGGGFQVAPEELRGYSAMLERVAGQFQQIEAHARDKGGDTAGFTGLLALLVPIVDGVVGLYAETLEFAHSKIGEVKANLDKTAEGYEAMENAGKDAFTKVLSDLDGARTVKVGGGA